MLFKRVSCFVLRIPISLIDCDNTGSGYYSGIKRRLGKTSSILVPVNHTVMSSHLTHELPVIDDSWFILSVCQQNRNLEFARVGKRYIIFHLSNQDISLQTQIKSKQKHAENNRRRPLGLSAVRQLYTMKRRTKNIQKT
jgi:hypothetical protein